MANTPMQDRWKNRIATKIVNMFTTHMAHPTFYPNLNSGCKSIMCQILIAMFPI
jgi:hypothetical protein